MILKITILFVAALLHTAQSLTCLQCNNTPQPRHCTTVTECGNDEICGVEKISDEFGDQLYNVGCMKKSKCMQSNNTHHCIECCASDLCNAKGCGQGGYPQNRGPICYNCPVHTNPKHCHLIDICRLGEVCVFDARREFGDLVYSSRCLDDHACRQGVSHEAALVGRRGVETNIETRSLAEHVCRDCCDKDICNNICNGSTPAGPCDKKPCVHGICHEENDNFFCVCDQGFDGKHCNVSTNHCLSNPCQHGQCHDSFNDYVCTCDQGYTGKQCNASTSRCLSNPCQHGQCYDGQNDFLCICDHGYRGKQCDMKNPYCTSNPCQHGNCTNTKDGYSCHCTKGYGGKNCETLVSDCYDILHKNISDKSGLYSVILWRSHKVIDVFCDMDTDNGGWTVFQRRFNGSVDFYRNFRDYENGFGNVFGEFWLGLEYIQEMTRNGTSELRLDLTAADGSHAYETFQNFRLSVRPNYTLHIDRGSGSAGDTSGLSYHDGYSFFTYDRDNAYNCAERDHGGWWYYQCAFANLNGEYITPGTVSHYHSGEGGITYGEFQGYMSLKKTTMMFRRVHS